MEACFGKFAFIILVNDMFLYTNFYGSKINKIAKMQTLTAANINGVTECQSCLEED